MRLLHQGFADQKCFVACRFQGRYIGSGVDSAFRYRQAFTGNFSRQLEGGFERDIECPQITAVDTDQIAAGIESTIQFLRVMGFAEDVEILRASGAGKRDQILLIQRGHDQQDGISTMGASFHDLQLIDDEILAQARERSCRRRLAEIVERTLEELFVSQNGERCGAGLLKFAGKFTGMKVGPDQAFRGRGFLQLGDDGDAIL